MAAPAGGFRPTGSSRGSGVSRFWFFRRRMAVAGLNRCAGRTRCNRVELAQRSDVVHHPDRATLRAGDEIVAVQDQVAHPGRRKLPLQRLPMVSVVEGHEHAGFRARIEQSRALQVGPHDADEVIGRKVAHGERPGRTVVLRAEDPGPEIVLAVIVDCDVGRAGLGRRRLDHADLGPGRQCPSASRRPRSCRRPASVARARHRCRSRSRRCRAAKARCSRSRHNRRPARARDRDCRRNRAPTRRARRDPG